MRAVRCIVWVDRQRSAGQVFSVAEAAEEAARAHRNGQRWDVRICTDRRGLGTRTRFMTEQEAAEFVPMVAALV